MRSLCNFVAQARIVPREGTARVFMITRAHVNNSPEFKPKCSLRPPPKPRGPTDSYSPCMPLAQKTSRSMRVSPHAVLSCAWTPPEILGLVHRAALPDRAEAAPAAALTRRASVKRIGPLN